MKKQDGLSDFGRAKYIAECALVNMGKQKGGGPRNTIWHENRTQYVGKVKAEYGNLTSQYIPALVVKLCEDLKRRNRTQPTLFDLLQKPKGKSSIPPK